MVSYHPVYLHFSLFLLLCVTDAVAGSGAEVDSAQKGQSQRVVDELVAASQKHQYQRQVSTSDPLWLAEKAAVDLAEDIAEYNFWMVEIIQRYAKGKTPSEADYLASRLPASGPAIAWGEIGLAAAKKGQANRAKKAMIELERYLWGINGQRLQEINGVRAEILWLIGEREAAEKLQQSLGVIESLELDARLKKQSIGELMSLEEAKARLQLCDAKGIDRLRARYLLACAEQQFKAGYREVAVRFLPEVGRLATSDGLPTAQYVLLDLARVCWAGGESKEAQKAMNVFFKCAERFPDEAEWKPIYLAEAAEILWQWGKKDEAKVWLEKSSQILPRTFILDAPKGILAVAKVADRMGASDAADSLIQRVGKIALSYKHAVPRAAALVQVYLYYSDAEREVPTAISEMLRSQPVSDKN